MRLFTLLLLTWGHLEIISAQRLPVNVPRPAANESASALVNNANNAVGNLMDSVGNLTDLVRISPSGANLNLIADTILDGVSKSVKTSGLDTLPLPDIDESINRMGVNIRIKANQGWIKDLSTLQRTANTALTSSGGNLTLTTGIGLERLEFGYDHYEFNSNIFNTRGMIDGKLGSNSAVVKLTIKLLGITDCSLTLDDLKIIGFDGLTIKLTGFGRFNMIVSRIATLILRALREVIVQEAQKEATRFLRQQLDTYSCQNILKLLLNQ